MDFEYALRRLKFLAHRRTAGWIQSGNSCWSVGWFYREFFTMSSPLYITSLLSWAPWYIARALRCCCESNWGIAFWYYYARMTTSLRFSLWARMLGSRSPLESQEVSKIYSNTSLVQLVVIIGHVAAVILILGSFRASWRVLHVHVHVYSVDRGCQWR